MGQNIRGFRGWRSDHEYFTHEWSDLAYLYLQSKQQHTKILSPKCLNIAEPRIFCPPKITRYTVYNSPWDLHLVENGGSVFLSTVHHFHWHLFQATKLYIYAATIYNNQFLEAAICTCKMLSFVTKAWIRLYTCYHTNNDATLLYSHYSIKH